MLKLLIADDEPKIRRGLAEALDWGELGIEIAGFAANGAETLKKVETLKPDICLVDINMPILNGLELIEQLRQQDSRTVCIIITGHDEFDYAQQAVRLGVFDYILKPVVDDLLRATVSRAAAYIAQRDSHEKEFELARAMLLRNMPLLRERFLCDFISGALIEQEIETLRTFHGLSISGIPALVVVQMSDDVIAQTKSAEWDRQLLRFAVRNVFEEMLSDCGTCYCATDEHENLFAIVDVIDSMRLSAFKEEFERFVETEFNRKIRTCTQTCTNFSQLPDAYGCILESLDETASPIIALARRIIDHNYMRSDFGFAQLAEELNVSEGHLSRLFKQETGMTFIEFLTRVRIQEAIVLLNDASLRICEIAERVGYNTQHYFCTAFRRVLGTSPTEYRQRKR